MTGRVASPARRGGLRAIGTVAWPDRRGGPRVGGAVALLAGLLSACAAGDTERADALDGSSAAAEAPTADGAASRAILLDPEHPAWAEPAPDTFRVTVRTSKGDFVIEAIRTWAPIGVDRFYNLVRHGYYDDARLHRVVPGFITQWGIAGDPDVTAVWYDRGMPDDPVVASNVRGTIAFAFTEPGTRSTQLYINMVDNRRLDAQGFAPIGRVVSGMEGVVDSIYSGYGESSGGGVRAGDQAPLVEGGNDFLDAAFPLLDRIVSATITG